MSDDPQTYTKADASRRVPTLAEMVADLRDIKARCPRPPPADSGMCMCCRCPIPGGQSVAIYPHQPSGPSLTPPLCYVCTPCWQGIMEASSPPPAPPGA